MQMQPLFLLSGTKQSTGKGYVASYDPPLHPLILTSIQRRLLANGFSISYLKGVEPLMLDCIKALIEVIDAQCDVNEGHKTRIDFYNVLSSLASVS